MKRSISILLFVVLALAACSPGLSQADVQSAVQATLTAWPTTVSVAGAGTFFDDFAYTGADDANLTARGWTPRAEAGGPGVPGATWASKSVSFVEDPDLPGNRLMQLASSTDGTAANTVQAELYQQRKFYAGTYASRVRFSDVPVSGPDGDNVVQAFFTITPLNYSMEPDYGEIDFEYLPNGGWGLDRNAFFLTTWETYQAEPWLADNVHEELPSSYDGWHTLLAQVSGVRVKYYIDGVPLAEHGDKYYPETPMSINYNQWFIDGGLVKENAARQYLEQVDWLYYAGQEVLTPEQVDKRVADYRAAQMAHVDTVPAWTPPVVTVPPTAVPTSTPIPTGARPFEAEINKVSGIKIDGELSDWPAGHTFTLAALSQIVYIAPGISWEGPQDLSAFVWAGWAEDGLYLAANVSDDKILQTQTGTLIWQGDYLELQLDTELEADFDDTSMSADDFQFGFSPGDFGNTKPATFVWAGTVSEAQLAQIQQAQTKTADGYIVEVFIPAELLPALVLKEGATFGMNINPSDSDLIPQEVMMSTSPTRKLHNPTTFGKIILSGE